MCEILGISGKNIESIKEAASFLEHREPDDSGLFINKFFGISLDHQRLAILDTSSFGH
jgi:asparagine synthetase B (glutamine-hydrolysing)